MAATQSDRKAQIRNKTHNKQTNQPHQQYHLKPPTSPPPSLPQSPSLPHPPPTPTEASSVGAQSDSSQLDRPRVQVRANSLETGMEGRTAVQTV